MLEFGTTREGRLRYYSPDEGVIENKDFKPPSNCPYILEITLE
jgi:hypothetical protein